MLGNIFEEIIELFIPDIVSCLLWLDDRADLLRIYFK